MDSRAFPLFSQSCSSLSETVVMKLLFISMNVLQKLTNRDDIRKYHLKSIMQISYREYHRLQIHS